ncbi:hypothetical protein [Acanthopleuribacter pedis]|uniref:Uncharacterized protein n=1 Tax=Acanthopleuribacter pedis TaxID=442870 RepID=A0A8J7Q6J6_9BACT|nr:hypothetical protein [Acanthopleuribacter pedis]MBO1321457.1 hypothetical protein [Acanthopleuribacter pedis]
MSHPQPTSNTPPDQHLAVTGLGLVTPIGLNTTQCFASFCAGVSRFQETDDFYCLASDEELAEPQPLVWSRLQTMDTEAGTQRIEALAVAAINDLLQHTRLRRRDLEGVVVVPVLPNAGTRHLVESLADETGLAFHPAPLGFYESDAAFSAGLAHVTELIHTHGARACLLVAADSLLASARLAELDRDGRIKSARNLDGFIPGEGAAAVLLESPETAQARGAEIHALVTARGDATEPHPPTADDATQGEGLSQALATCAEQTADGRLPGWVVTTFNGESRQAREWGHCLVRLQNKLPVRHMWYPAENLGHTGVAAAIGFSIAAFALGQGYAPESSALLTALGHDAQRAGLVLSQFGFAAQY